jgi:hypothetical protein
MMGGTALRPLGGFGRRMGDMFRKTMLALLTALMAAIVLERGFGIDLGLQDTIDREQAALDEELSFVE